MYITTYSFSRTLSDTPPRNPNKPPMMAVIISTASIWYASHDANLLKNVAHNMAINTWARIFPNSILAINLTSTIKMRHITRIIPLGRYGFGLSDFTLSQAAM